MADEILAAVVEPVVETEDPMHAKMVALRAALVNARNKVTGGKRQNMLDQVADGCIDAIEAMLTVLPN